MYIGDIMTTYTLTEARKHFPEIIDKTHRLFEEFVVSKKGIPTAVIVDYDLFEGMKETLNLVLDKKLYTRLKKAREESKLGAGKSWAQLRKEMGL
jgi:prevent-host-death family protein